NIYSVREGKVFTVTLKIMTHMGILSDRQITLYRIHAQKRLCKRNFYFGGKHVEIKNSLYGCKATESEFVT
ncbi:MAG: hypothetical protein J5649_09735, partial [Lachnospiraceae bacterium]|nr:hypothetical protein [Lachnospiraceae bacterium]